MFVPQVGNMYESIIEGGEDAADTEDEGALKIVALAFHLL